MLISGSGATPRSELTSNPGILDGIPPTVQIISPCESDSFTYDLPLTIQWSAIDSSFGATPIQIEFIKSDNDVQIIIPATENDSSFQWTTPDVPSGLYTLTVAAIDSFGNNTTKTSDPFFILGSNPDNCWFVSKSGDDVLNNGTADFPYASIQKALNECREEDSVLISTGTYFETISTLDKSVFISSISGPEETIIDANYSGSDVVTLYENSHLAGFTIQNSATGAQYAGVRISSGSASVIHSNKIFDNINGIIIEENSNPTIKNNIITGGNTLILCQDGSEVLIENNTLIGGKTGIGILGSDIVFTITNNIITNNQGIGGINFEIIPENDPVITYNNVWNNTPSNYNGFNDYTGTDGNISENPQFVNYAERDFHLLSTSPSIDAGDPDSDYQNEPEPNGDRINMGYYGNTAEAGCNILKFTDNIQNSTYEDSLYTQALGLYDETNVNITLDVIQLPSWLSLNQDNSAIGGIPDNTHVGNFSVCIAAEDNYGRKDTLDYQLTVINSLPVITSVPVTVAWEETNYNYDVNCSDDGQGDIRYYLNEPDWLTIDSLSGEISGIPLNDHIGNHLVEIEVHDGNGGIGTQSFTLNVVNINDAPVLSIFPDQLIEEDTYLTIPISDWRNYVIDIDNDFEELQWQLGNGLHSNSTVHGDSITVSPDENWYGTDSIVVIVSDSTLSDTSFFHLGVTPVNDYPVWTLPPDTSMHFKDSLVIYLADYVFDVDDPDSSLSFNMTTGFIPEDFSLSIALTDNNILKIKPYKNTELIDGQIFLSVSDTANAQTLDTLILTIFKYNFPPELAQLPDIVGHEDTSVIIPLSQWLDYVTDLDDSLSLLTWYIPNTDHISITIDNDTAIFTPLKNWFGTDTVTVYILDEKDSAFVQITADFHSVADTPQLSFYDFRFCEDETLTVHLDDFVKDVDSPDSILQWNITFEGSSPDPPVSEFHFLFDSTLRSLQFWGDPDFFIDSIHVFYTVSDDSGLTNTTSNFISISPINDPPVAPEFLSWEPNLFEDTEFIINFSDFQDQISDVETPLDTLNCELFPTANIFIKNISEPNIYIMQCAPDWYGYDTLLVHISDDSCTVISYLPLFIQPVNDPPVITAIPDTVFNEDDSVKIDLKKYVFDIDTPDDLLNFQINPDSRQSILIVQFNTSSWEMLIKGIPNGFTENAQIIYEVWDDYNSRCSDTSLVTILPVNDAPVLLSSLDTTYFEDEKLIIPANSLLEFIYDADHPDSLLSIDITKDSGMVFYKYDQPSGSHQFWSNKDVNGNGYFTIQVQDPPGETLRQSFTVDVIPVNDAPVLTGFPDTSAVQDSTFTLPLSDFWYDVDNQLSELQWTISANISDIQITTGGDTLLCKPPDAYVGWDTVYAMLTDIEGLFDRDTFRVHFDDSKPPSFSIGVFQNPIATEHLDIYFFPNETIDSIHTLTISDESVVPDLITGIQPNPYHTHYRLQKSAVQHISITAADTTGNTGTTEYDFSSTYVLKKAGGVIFSPDSAASFTLINHTLKSDAYILCLPNTSDSSLIAKKPQLKIAKFSTNFKEMDYTFTGPQTILSKNGKLNFTIPEEQPQRMAIRPGVFMWENGKWKYLKTYTDAGRQHYWVYTNEFCRYSLQFDAPEEAEQLPTEISLAQNFPNPFNSTTTIQFELPELASGVFESGVQLIIYDILGRKVMTLFNKPAVPGRYVVRWNGQNSHGQTIASGVYLYSLQYGNHQKTKKMVLIK